MEKKLEETLTPEVGKEKQPTLQEILADDKKSALFGEMLKSEGDSEMAKRLMGKDKDKMISEEDLKELTGKKLENFLGRMKSVEVCSGTMTPEAMNRILGGKSEKFQMIVKAVGVEGARNSIVPQLEMLAMRDPDRFKRIVGSFDFLNKKDTEIKKGKEINNAIEKFCKDNNITEEEYSDVEKESTHEGRTKFFEKKFNEKFEDINKIGERIQWFWQKSRKEPSDRNERIQIKKRNELNEYIKEQVGKVHSRIDIERLKSDLEPRLKSIGGVLGATILENEDMNTAFQRILKGEEAPEEELFGFKDAGEAIPDQDTFDKEYEKWKKKEEETVGKASDMKTFSDFYVKKKIGNKKGFWGDIAKKLIEGLVKI